MIRRAKALTLPAGIEPRRVPFGVTRGLRISNDLRGPAYLPLGLYEYEIQHWLRKLAAQGGLAYDVGAASGVQTLALARLTGREVVAFERDTDALESLHHHLRINAGVGRLVEVVERFAGAQTAGVVVALDDFVGDREPPTMLKIDVEGAELEVILGARQLLQTHRPHLLIETHGAELEAEVADALVTIGYRVVVVPRRKRLREDRPALHNRWLVASGRPAVR